MSESRKRIEEFAQIYGLSLEQAEKLIFCGQVIREGFPSNLRGSGDQKSHSQEGECDNPSGPYNPEGNPDTDPTDGGSES